MWALWHNNNNSEQLKISTDTVLKHPLRKDTRLCKKFRISTTANLKKHHVAATLGCNSSCKSTKFHSGPCITTSALNLSPNVILNSPRLCLIWLPAAGPIWSNSLVFDFFFFSNTSSWKSCVSTFASNKCFTSFKNVPLLRLNCFISPGSLAYLIPRAKSNATRSIGHKIMSDDKILRLFWQLFKMPGSRRLQNLHKSWGSTCPI